MPYCCAPHYTRCCAVYCMPHHCTPHYMPRHCCTAHGMPHHCTPHCMPRHCCTAHGMPRHCCTAHCMPRHCCTAHGMPHHCCTAHYTAQVVAFLERELSKLRLQRMVRRRANKQPVSHPPLQSQEQAEQVTLPVPCCLYPAASTLLPLSVPCCQYPVATPLLPLRCRCHCRLRRRGSKPKKNC